MPSGPIRVHGAGDQQEMLRELRRQILIGRVVRRELEGDLEHVLAEQRHPGRAVGLLQMAAGRQRRAAVEDADIVEPEKAAFEEASCRSGPCGSPTS